MSNSDSGLLEIVPTKAVLFKEGAKSQFKAIVYESHKSKHSEDVGNVIATPYRGGNQNDSPEFDIKKVRHEVMRFGISGFTTRNKKKAEIALAIQLGAKAPKKVCKNYKNLVHEKKMAKKQKEESLKLRQLGKNQTGAAIIRYKKPKLPKKNMGEISKHYGVVNPKIHKR